ncbi:MAG TPA: hypothetical protein DCQ26_12475 [Marinilabiliales bacterium]|jgi:hypothetical protein|nr:MAG: hypothetical protein A2W95_05765 [Bacteroidetes bacterium GWA2_40_14]OFX61751.1 MAG: hypothetical protein A2W84_13550 [Bacteroidetes bacterium GWC2_40_13]OFX76033.1 MAG: hypothetical protein A2W96_01115 [Bacteroidetes bacterium GWD2_40_43]OFX94353.1 MAG: hypothetical protein A2W97_19505 [Bacteroidetes bacterium GWE2_40_63]OFY18831.1 MAG: hypothetical protein A2W88_06270 [Bacteroidetes bacterium GWF2_40_13]OFZ24807.1 MAG: hypothetical protein A2437_15835 [Bacteroidetes bacterium RIFOXYC
MNIEKQDNTAYILDTLIEKSVVKQETYLVTLENFFTLKKVIKYLIDNYAKQLKNESQKIALDFTDNGIFEAKMQVAGDLIIFNMHSNIFTFDEKHWIWNHDYVKNNELNGYFGVINVYNFLADSFKYNRLGDYGFLIARIFINREGYYFLEGNANFGSFNEDFGKNKIDISRMREMIQSIITYSLEVDLVVPPMENIQIATVEQMMDKMNMSKVETGKPLGFKSSAK